MAGELLPLRYMLGNHLYSSSADPPEPHQIKNDTLCEFCAGLNLTVADFTGSRDGGPAGQRASFQRVMLPPLPVVWSQGCSFCMSLVSALISSNTDIATSTTSSLYELEYGLEWVKDGRKLQKHDTASASTRRLRLFAHGERLNDAYLVLLAPSDSKGQFLGRRVSPTTIDLRQVQQWLATCEERHDRCKVAPEQFNAGNLYQNTAFKLIDVKEGCVVMPKGPERFVALSYVWGTVKTPIAKQDNIMQMMQPGFFTALSEEIPPTIKDAMELTGLLGHRYLWVDSLCIVQDNTSEKAAIINAMDAVYSNAALTICAAGGDAAFGIRGIANGSRKFRQNIIRYNDSIQLMVSHPAESFIKRSRWDSRAWTFQERICSRKLLIFAHDRVFYNCRHSMMCEDIHMEDDTPATELENWSLEMKDALGRLFLENPLRQYTKCVQIYTGRQMSFSVDKLSAFSAIAVLLGTNLASDFQAGLPTSYLDFALLWTPRESLRRIPNFPSWSWSGWDRAMEYSYPTLEGTLTNIHEWLRLRTWIDWYILTPHSEPALAWSGQRSGLQGRWRGYAMPNDMGPYGRTLPGDSLPTPDSRPSGRKRNLDRRRGDYNEVTSAPTYLQFHTFSAFFRVDPVPPARHSRSDMDPDLHWYSLFDADGDWCGAVLLDKAWIGGGDPALHEDDFDRFLDPSAPNSTETTHEFIAISEAKDFSTEEHDSWTYYVPMDRIDSQWGLYYVLLIVTNDLGICERRGIGKVFKDAFKKSHAPGHSWKEFTMG